MKIAYLSIEFPPRIFGGLGVYVDEISRELAGLGESISVFTQGGDNLKPQQRMEGVDVFRYDPVPISDGLDIFLSGETLAWGEGLLFFEELLALNQLSAAGIVENGPFDLCVAHDWLGLWGGMAAKRKGVPLIYHVHGLEAGRSESPNPQLISLERRGADVSDGIITVSEAMKRELVGLGAEAEKISVCYHGVNSGFFDPARADAAALAALRAGYGIAGGETVILFVGRLEPVKGVRELLAALPAVLAEHPGVRLLLVGKGSLEGFVREQSRHLPPGKVILVTEFLDAASKMHHYALADLCVFPSIYEPFGIVALEAAAMGRAAVVGTAGTSGLGEIVRNPADPRPTGVHVNARNPADLAWGINLALEDEERRRAWGENARERARTQFSWRRAAESTLEIYRRVAGQ